MKNYKAEIEKALINENDGYSTYGHSKAYKIRQEQCIKDVMSLIREVVKEAVGEKEERELNPNGRYLQIALDNQAKEARNAFRSKILSNIEKLLK